MSASDKRRKSRRFPEWMKKRIPASGTIQEVRSLLNDLQLPTVCQSARCPNLCECFSKGTATFMILGDHCTRDCRFCAVPHGELPPPDPTEPERLAEAAERMKLRHVVVTSVTRDDLPDGGAAHFRDTILAIRARHKCTIEVLTPDFQGNQESIACVAHARPDVFNHNIETVRRLYPTVRPDADYDRSLQFLAEAKRREPSLATKSGIMVGLGEKEEEVIELLADLRSVGCDFITIGQYLQPTADHLPIDRFVTPEEFDRYEVAGMDMGFNAVFSGPFVRSSYQAGHMLSGSQGDDEDACNCSSPENLAK
jgi:lipoyl synthase